MPSGRGAKLRGDVCLFHTGRIQIDGADINACAAAPKFQLVFANNLFDVWIQLGLTGDHALDKLVYLACCRPRKFQEFLLCLLQLGGTLYDSVPNQDRHVHCTVNGGVVVPRLLGNRTGEIYERVDHVGPSSSLFSCGKSLSGLVGMDMLDDAWLGLSKGAESAPTITWV